VSEAVACAALQALMWLCRVHFRTLLCCALLSTTDPSHSGTVTSSEFRNVLQACGYPLSAVELALLSRHFATTDGKVNLTRFKQFVLSGTSLRCDSQTRARAFYTLCDRLCYLLDYPLHCGLTRCTRT
jgi:hypothetical protein